MGIDEPAGYRAAHDDGKRGSPASAMQRSWPVRGRWRTDSDRARCRARVRLRQSRAGSSAGRTAADVRTKAIAGSTAGPRRSRIRPSSDACRCAAAAARLGYWPSRKPRNSIPAPKPYWPGVKPSCEFICSAAKLMFTRSRELRSMKRIVGNASRQSTLRLIACCMDCMGLPYHVKRLHGQAGAARRGVLCGLLRRRCCRRGRRPADASAPSRSTMRDASNSAVRARTAST